MQQKFYLIASYLFVLLSINACESNQENTTQNSRPNIDPQTVNQVDSQNLAPEPNSQSLCVGMLDTLELAIDSLKSLKNKAIRQAGKKVSLKNEQDLENILIKIINTSQDIKVLNRQQKQVRRLEKVFIKMQKKKEIEEACQKRYVQVHANILELKSILKIVKKQ